MRVRIEGSGVFSELAQTHPEMDGVTTVADVLLRLDLPSRTAYLILVNDRLASPDSILHSGDVVQLVPAVGGGSE